VSCRSILSGLAILCVAAPAFAEGGAGANVHVARAAELIRTGSLNDPAVRLAPVGRAELVLTPSPLVAVEMTDDAAVVSSKSRVPPAKARHEAEHRCSLVTACGYHKVLSELIITRDIEVPGTQLLALRLIPTSSALAGTSTSPIVVKPRVLGTSWYGVDVAARF
jgi:hypothetical protein